jgi:GDP-L-fucose synthase
VNKDASVFVAGHLGLAGSAIVRRLRGSGYSNILTRTRTQLDLRDQAAVERFFATTRPQWVVLAAAKVGGIHANSTYPAEFLRDNLQVQTNVIDSSQRHGVRKLVFLASSCIYPRLAPQPIQEEQLLRGELEPTNQWYAIAKIAGLKMCQAYRRQFGFDAISLMPTNLYGPGDNFSALDSHVLPALIRKFHEAHLAGAASVAVWGTGKPRREFLYVDDFADAACLLLEQYSSEEPINVGCGEDVSIAELATQIARIVGFKGRIEYDTSKPDGTPRKWLDVSRLNALGWKPRTPLAVGIAETYQWFVANQAAVRQ